MLILPADVARCDGKRYAPPTLDWGCIAKECMDCVRRIAPYGSRNVLMEPPRETPCPMRRIAEVAHE